MSFEKIPTEPTELNDREKEIIEELRTFIDEQIPKINEIKNVKELKEYLDKSTDDSYLAKKAEKNSGVDLGILKALYGIGYVSTELIQHVNKAKPICDPFSTIEGRFEKNISNLPKEVQDKSREYVNALMGKARELTVEVKD